MVCGCGFWLELSWDEGCGEQAVVCLKGSWWGENVRLALRREKVKWFHLGAFLAIYEISGVCDW